MSDPVASRPRPRPRPKPKPKTPANVASSSQQPAAASSSSIPPSSPSFHQIQVDDDDEIFMRNRNRTAQTWKKLEHIDKEAEARAPRPGSGSEDEGGSPRPRKHKKKAEKVPRWQDKNVIRLLSVDLSDSEDALQDIENTPDSRNKRKRGGATGLTANRRSKSRSITPPPALPIQQLQNARNVVRQTLESAPRPASPIQYHDFDESTDTIVLDPELALIAKTYAESQQSQASSSADLYPQSQSQTQDEIDEDETVELTVKWIPHPLNESGRAQVWAFKMHRGDSFRDLFEATADLVHILTDNLIMSYDSKRIFPSVTPNTLNLPEEATLEACDKTTYEYLRKHRNQPPDIQSLDPPSEDDDDDSRARSLSIADQESETESVGGEQFKLILRSAATKDKDITLNVRPTTKCGAIVRAFLKKAGLSDKYPAGGTAPAKKGKAAKAKSATTAVPEPRLVIDGEKMDPEAEIGDADLEDGDLVEVVGL